MKIFYFLNLDQYKTNQGIILKSIQKVKFWLSKGHEVKFTIVYHFEDDREIIEQYFKPFFIKRQLQKFPGHLRILRFLGIEPLHEHLIYKEIQDFDPDIVYHRTFEMSGFIRNISKRTNAVIEINGNELGNLQARRSSIFHSVMIAIRIARIKLSLGKFLESHKGIVFVSYELQKIYAKRAQCDSLYQKSIVLPNSIDVDSYDKRKKSSPSPDEKVRLAFLGTPNLPWQGTDIILKLAEQTKNELEFHIIGEEFSTSEKLPENVFTYGYLSQREYRDLLIQCHIGIGTLSLGNTKTEEASPLKVREYAAAGLPVIVAYRDTAFINRDVPEWVLEIRVDRGDIMRWEKEIVNFCLRFRNYVVPVKDVKDLFSLEESELKRLSFFERVIGKNKEIEKLLRIDQNVN